MEPKDIGYKSMTEIAVLSVGALLFFAFGIIFAVILGWEDAIIVVVDLFLFAVGVCFAVYAFVCAIRPKVIVRMDEKNLYVYRFSDWTKISLDSVARIRTMHGNGIFRGAGKLIVILLDGTKVSVIGLEDVIGVRSRIQSNMDRFGTF